MLDMLFNLSCFTIIGKALWILFEELEFLLLVLVFGKLF